MAIQLLDPHTAELIAAGEVVERPASVVKELCENAIDANASVIKVEIEKGGVALIRITDDGDGIEFGDIELAFVRHATSKVRAEEDLYTIYTLGFRGEALASVASVSRVELLTKNDADEDATRYTVDGGQGGEKMPAARPRGTTITVRDLFYNTPARMKFLKKDASEAGYVTETVTRLALSHPDIAFRYVRDGNEVFSTPGNGDIRGAAYAALGPAFSRELIPVGDLGQNSRVIGLVSPPGAARASRSMQFFFINGRYVKNRTMMAALEQAYRGMVMHGRYPGGILFLQIVADLVDVNVHPAKTEVRFANEQDVFGVVYRAVKAALLEGGQGYAALSFGGEEAAPGTEAAEGPGATPDMPGEEPNGAGWPPYGGEDAPSAAGPGQPGAGAYGAVAWQAAQDAEELESTSLYVPYTTSRVAQSHPPYVPVVGEEEGRAPRQEDVTAGGAPPEETPPGGRAPLWGDTPATLSERFLDIEAPPEEEPEETPEETPPGGRVPLWGDAADASDEYFPDTDAPPEEPWAEQQQMEDGGEGQCPLRYVGELFKTYIVAQWEDSLCLVDKHAAHERILYEQLAAGRGPAASQRLLSPVHVALSAEEKNALLQNEEALAAAGMELEDFGGNAVLVRGVPADLDAPDIENLVVEAAGRLAVNEKDNANEKTEWVLHSVACRTAVKAGDATPPEALVALAGDILLGRTPPFCPHGRPVVLKITRKELEKQFGRLG